ALQQHLERAFVALVGELGLEHVEAQLAFVGAIALAGYEFETRFGIDEAPYQPGAGDAIDIYALSRHPGPVAKDPKRACPGINRRLLRHGLALVQSSLYISDQTFRGFAADRAEEIDRNPLGQTVARPRGLPAKLGDGLGLCVGAQRLSQRARVLDHLGVVGVARAVEQPAHLLVRKAVDQAGFTEKRF